jgi:hypothetical protein
MALHYRNRRPHGGKWARRRLNIVFATGRAHTESGNPAGSIEAKEKKSCSAARRLSGNPVGKIRCGAPAASIPPLEKSPKSTGFGRKFSREAIKPVER